MVKPIMFVDFNGTICHDKYWRSLPAEAFQQVQDLLFRGDSTSVHDWMLGKYSAEEINQFLADKTGLPYTQLWDLFVRDCCNMRVSPLVLDRLSALRTHYTVILITGNMDSFSRFTVPALKLENYFDGISNSYDEGQHKTDENGALFAEYAGKFQARLAECILMDDSAGACSVFEKLGGRAFLITAERDIYYYLERLED